MIRTDNGSRRAVFLLSGVWCLQKKVEIAGRCKYVKIRFETINNQQSTRSEPNPIFGHFENACENFVHKTMSTFEGEPIEVGYWAIRGLGAPLRMMVMFSGNPLKVSNYECCENAEGTDFDHSAWFSVKPGFKARNALINLPYVQIGDRLITQTNACFLALGRHLGMLGDNEDELIQCEQLLCEAMDLRNRVVAVVYPADQDLAHFLHNAVNNANGQLAKLELWLQRKYEGESPAEEALFFVGMRASAPDFHIWELLDQLLRMASFAGVDNLLATLPVLQTFHARFATLPANARYLQSGLFRLPCNNNNAKTFGATPSGAVWKMKETEHSWRGLSGLY